jgi:hypothetical protein
MGLLSTIMNSQHMAKGAGLATHMFGRFDSTSSILSRFVKPLAYAVPGLAGAGYIMHKGKEMENYYGSSRYSSYYGQGRETAAGISAGAGLFYGIMGMLHKDPYSRIKTSLNFWTKERHLLKTASPVKEAMIRSSPGLGTGWGKSSTSKAASFLVGATRVGTWVGMTSAPSYFTGTGMITSAVGGTLTAGAISGLGLGAMAVGRRGVNPSHLLGFAGSVAAASGGAYAGWKLASNVNAPAAEGNIIGFDQGSPTSRMNYSTAGLVQALYKNRKQY